MAQSSNAWMSTFSDLLLLMLTFFVLLLTMSTIDKQSIDEMSEVNKDKGFKIKRDLPGTTIFKSNKGTSEIKKNFKKLSERMKNLSTAKPTSQKKIKSQLAEIFEASDVEGKAWLDFRPNGVVINLDGVVAFKGETAELTERAKKFLRHFASIVRPNQFNIAVESYVSQANTFRGQEQNWRLALTRADKTVNFLFEQGVSENRARMMGYAPSTIENKNPEYMQSGSLLELHILAGPPTAEAAN